MPHEPGQIAAASEPQTGADIIAARLRAAGCTFAFGMPGGEVLALVAALDRAGIRFILTRHETAGGFMAEGACHATAAPAVLVATLGPGVANAVNAITNAWQEGVPLIFLTGCVDEVEAVCYTHQIFDHAQLLRPITKASLRATAGAVATVIDKALAIALDGTPGPVHVDVPISAAAGPASPAGRTRRATSQPLAPAASPGLEDARQRFAHAQNPLMIVGREVLTQGGTAAVRDFAHRYGIPVITTYKAKGLLDEAEDPLALGAAGFSPRADASLLSLVGKADVLLLAGYNPIEMRPHWQQPWSDSATVVSFGMSPNTHYMHQETHVFLCDIGLGLAALANGTPRQPVWPNGEPAQVRAGRQYPASPVEDWGPAAAFAALRRALPQDCVVTVDSGAHRILFSQQWACPRPGLILQSTALCTMGCALPLAIGYRLARQQQPVVAVTGDAGLEMVLGELATLRDLALPVIVLVMVDGTLNLIGMKQRERQMAAVGVDFGLTDFAAVAEALGGNGTTVTNAAALEHAVTRALAQPQFTVIACRIDPRAYDGLI